MNFKKDYYYILGLSPSSSKEEIKAAYRQLAKQFHPDRSPDADPQIMQDINEAYEILSDPIKKREYDEYITAAEPQAEVEAEVEEEKEVQKKEQHSHIRRYQKQTTVAELEKLYLKGKVSIKFWADPIELNSKFPEEQHFKLHPTECTVYVYEHDIAIRDTPAGWEQAIEEVELFKTPLKQPIRCVIKGADETLVYQIDLYNIRVGNIQLSDIVKDNEQSLGTLQGELFAEVHHTIYREHTEWVTECYGTTGRVETKEEDDWVWQRTEYYHTDCSTYWSGWEKIETIRKTAPKQNHADNYGPWKTPGKSSPKYGTGYARSHSVAISSGASDGCLPLVVLIFLIIFFMGLFTAGLPALAFFIAFGILIMGTVFLYWIRRIIPILYLVAVVGLIISGIWSSLINSGKGSPGRSRKENSTVVSSKRPNNNSSTKDAKSIDDSLLVHTVTWLGFDSVMYSVNLPINTGRILVSQEYHKIISGQRFNEIGAVYKSLNQFDEPSLAGVFNAFDSLKNLHQLDEAGFADLMVSCVQSLPYYLVLNESCNESSYTDNYVREYLQNCEVECCVGETVFGVRSPVEYMSDLKGDCDTKALFLYSLFKHFNYNVGIITSEDFRHAAIAVEVDKTFSKQPDIFRIGEIDLYAWETTSYGFRVGELPENVNNLNKWQISLFNKKHNQ